MKLLIVSNLLPRPDQPRRGVFNAQLVDKLAERCEVARVCLVPVWRGMGTRSVFRVPCSVDAGLQETSYVPVFYVPVVGRSLSGWTYERGLRRAEERFRECDVVLATWLYPDAVAAARMARQCGKPVWIKVHGSDRFHLRHRLRRRAILEAVTYARGVITNGEFLAEALAVEGIDRKKLHVVRHGIDHERFRYRSREEAWARLERSDFARVKTSRIILFVGNLAPVKGPEVALRAFATSRQTSNIQMVVIGEGAMSRRLEKQAAALGIGDAVCFLGSRPHDEVALWMNAADCLCLTSRSEGMANVVLEALASGLPVVATDAGDVPRYVKDGENGFVVGWKGGDMASRIAAALAETLTRRWDRETMASAVALPTWDECAEKVYALLEAKTTC